MGHPGLGFENNQSIENAPEQILPNISEAVALLTENTEKYRNIPERSDRWNQVISDFNEKFGTQYSKKDIEFYFFENDLFLGIRLFGGPLLKPFETKTMAIKDVSELQGIFPIDLWNTVKNIKIEVRIIDDTEWRNLGAKDEYGYVYINTGRITGEDGFKMTQANEFIHVILNKLGFTHNKFEGVNFSNSEGIKEYIIDTNSRHLHEFMSDVGGISVNVRNIKGIMKDLLYMSKRDGNSVVTHVQHSYSYSWYFLREQIFNNPEAIPFFAEGLEIVLKMRANEGNYQDLEKDLDRIVDEIFTILESTNIRDAYIQHGRELLTQAILPAIGD